MSYMLIIPALRRLRREVTSLYYPARPYLQSNNNNNKSRLGLAPVVEHSPRAQEDGVWSPAL